MSVQDPIDPPAPAPAQRKPLGEISGNTQIEPSAAAAKSLFIAEYDEDELLSEPPSDPAPEDLELADNDKGEGSNEFAKIAGAAETASQIPVSQAGLTQAFESPVPRSGARQRSRSLLDEDPAGVVDVRWRASFGDPDKNSIPKANDSELNYSLAIVDRTRLWQ
ncbi:hypothetical protein BDV95DRAFT_575908 [Massariosphaeria phaeospora]|uniref:Uncharacterized protein n=1 Tax=Massariosphaeria phaeospora TaxID=100035 RepID=A0A7C8I352_9PLEO|nr:hypothetical protein BDV95DRAFT_575908 [Massariosphaeria phaeospora]